MSLDKGGDIRACTEQVFGELDNCCWPDEPLASDCPLLLVVVRWSPLPGPESFFKFGIVLLRARWKPLAASQSSSWILVSSLASLLSLLIFRALKSFMTTVWSIILEFLLGILSLHVSLNSVSTGLSLRPLVPGALNFKTASLKIVLLLVFSIVFPFLDGLKFVVLLIPLGLIENMIGLLGMDLLRNKQLLLELSPNILNRFVGFSLSAIAMWGQLVERRSISSLWRRAGSTSSSSPIFVAGESVVTQHRAVRQTGTPCARGSTKRAQLGLG